MKCHRVLVASILVLFPCVSILNERTEKADGGAPVLHQACIRFVDAAVSAPGDGFAWRRACATLQEGIASAQRALLADAALPSCEVWVRKGVYYVYRNRRMDTLQLASRVALYGGFEGSEKSRSQRDFEKNPTIIDGRDQPNGQNQVYHVVTGADQAVLDGFTIANGNAKRGRHGAGMYNDGVSPTVSNCRFEGNIAGFYGGGMFNSSNAPVIDNCLFVNNQAKYGGAISSQNSRLKVSGSFFSFNSARSDGGAIMNDSFTDAVIANSVFIGNSARQNGGAIYNYHKSIPTITSCIFAGNHARDNGGAICSRTYSGAKIANSILWDDDLKKGAKEIVSSSEQSTDVSFSIVKGGFKGKENADTDPLLVLSQDGRVRLSPGSPYIDAVNATIALATDVLGNSRTDDQSVLDFMTTSAETEEDAGRADMDAAELPPDGTDM